MRTIPMTQPIHTEQMPAWHRPWFRYLTTPDQGGAGGGEGGDEGDGSDGEQTFTQADVDRLVGSARQDERRKATAKYSDYDDLKQKAEGAKTVEQQLADLKSEVTEARTSALRSDIATKHGISAEDRDLFLTGTDEETLTKQAKRLASRDAEKRQKGGVVRREGGNRGNNDKDSTMREFTRELFQTNDD